MEHYRELALELVAEYENHVRLAPLADPENREYVVGPYQPSGTVRKAFKNAAHRHYDTKAFNGDELEMAKALDRLGGPCVRNKDRLDYGIPLPVKSGTSGTFYPDFLWWSKETVWAIDPTAKHILNEKIRSKLLEVPNPMKIALVTRGKLNRGYRWISEEGWTLVRLRAGNAAPETFETVGELLATLEGESEDA